MKSSRFTISITRPVKISGTVVVETANKAQAIAMAKNMLSRDIDKLEAAELYDGEHPWIFDDQGGNDDEIIVVKVDDIPGAVEYSENALSEKADRIKTLAQIIEIATERLCPDDMSYQEWSAFSTELQQQLVRLIKEKFE